VNNTLPDPETRITTFAGVKPTPAVNQVQMRRYVDDLIARGALSMLIYAEMAEGKMAVAAVGSPLGLRELAQLGPSQLEDMLQRGNRSGENG